MNVSMSTRQLVAFFGLLTGLFLLFLLSAEPADASSRLSYEDRFLNHFCPALAIRGFEPSYCDQTEPEPDPDEPTVMFEADDLSVPAGETTTLTWNSDHTDSCEASDGWSGTKTTNGSEVVTVSATTTYTITCTGEGGEATKSVTIAAEVEEEPEPEVPTVDIDADHLLVPVGSTTIIFWESEHADSCQASDGWSGSKATEGSEVVTINATTTYTITCAGEGGEATKSVTIAAEIIPDAEPDEPSLELTANPTVVNAGETATISWLADGVDTCTASQDWSGDKGLSGSEVVVVDEPNTFTLTCTGDGVSLSKSVAVTVFDPAPEPETDHLLITEVLYDLSDDQGSESGGANEWVEIYNPTDSAVDLMNWQIGDGASNDLISDTSLVLAPGEYLVITNATSTAEYWDFSEVMVVYLQSSISSGLANTGDVVKLFDETEAEIDAVSYGTNITALDPAAPDAPEGSSIERIDSTTDTDSAADWQANEAPTPGG